MAYVLKFVSLLLILSFNYASSDQTRDVLSRLYNKAARERRPMIIVLDKTSKLGSLGSSLDGQNNLDSDEQNLLPMLLLHKLGQYQSNQNRSPSKNRLLHNSDKYLNRHEIDLDHIHRDDITNHGLVKERLANKDARGSKNKKNREHDRSQTLKITIKAPVKGNVRTRTDIKERVLQSSIIDNILRYGNGKCKVIKNDECDVKVDSCEVQIDCAEEEDKDCEFSDSCNVEDKQISTKGELLLPNGAWRALRQL